MALRVKVGAWSAWGTGLETVGAIAGYTPGAYYNDENSRPSAPSFLSPSLRRRCSRATLIAAELLSRVIEDNRLGASPYLVFCSRHGESSTTERILRAVARREPVSPTDFMLSVHNTTAGMISLALEARQPNTALAAGDGSLAAGLLEGAAALADGTPSVCVVYTDDQLPEVFSDSTAPISPPVGLAFHFTALSSGSSAGTLEFEWCAEPAPSSGDGAHVDAIGLMKWLIGDSGSTLLPLDTGALRLCKQGGFTELFRGNASVS